ncbi:hypothetical protein PG984_005047 [Apiospora sp. TS-2023a]
MSLPWHASTLVRDRAEELLFPGLAGILERAATLYCDRYRRVTYGAQAAVHGFGGRGYVESLPERAKEVYPDLVLKAPPPPSGAQESEKKNKKAKENERKKEGAIVGEEYTPEMFRGMVDNDRFEAGSVEGLRMDGNSHCIHDSKHTLQTMEV